THTSILPIIFFLLLIIPPPPIFTLFPYTTLFRSPILLHNFYRINFLTIIYNFLIVPIFNFILLPLTFIVIFIFWCLPYIVRISEDRKSTRLNSSHVSISYAVFCLKKKKILYIQDV